MPEMSVQTPVSSVRPTPVSARAQSLNLPWAVFNRDGTDVLDANTPASNVENRWTIEYQSGHSAFSQWADDAYNYVGVPDTGMFMWQMVVEPTADTFAWASSPTTGQSYANLNVVVNGNGVFGVDPHIDNPFVFGEASGGTPAARFFTGMVDKGYAQGKIEATCRTMDTYFAMSGGSTLTFDLRLFICQISPQDPY